MFGDANDCENDSRTIEIGDRETRSTERSARHAPPPLEVLRAKLDRAIVAEAWDAVKVIAARIRELERADVVNLATERAKRK
jgi:hypothetical protein